LYQGDATTVTINVKNDGENTSLSLKKLSFVSFGAYRALCSMSQNTGAATNAVLLYPAAMKYIFTENAFLKICIL
jgi:hypothetical protein